MIRWENREEGLLHTFKCRFTSKEKRSIESKTRRSSHYITQGQPLINQPTLSTKRVKTKGPRGLKILGLSQDPEKLERGSTTNILIAAMFGTIPPLASNLHQLSPKPTNADQKRGDLKPAKQERNLLLEEG
ncbi:hypothetical protein CDAR_24091 [Caerostris darwini]|uniref:Uncharacterized protein n=1 Tax=Caerostris darwini TaxID=1538125 RepID=A0AAV4QHU6_9ARAC|nr:hypothetical protein CDAR_24091 [Caerostris darwini]